MLFDFCWWQLYKAALGNCFEAEEWGPIEFSIMAKHFERQGKSPYAYHAVSFMMLVIESTSPHLYIQYCV